MLEKLILDGVLALYEYFPTLGHHLLKFCFKLSHPSKGDLGLLSLRLQVLNLALKPSHLIFSTFSPILKGKTRTVGVTQVYL